MLAAGELAVRRVAKFEVKDKASVRGTKFSFRVTSRIQVSCDHQSCSPPWSTYVSPYLQLLLVALSMCNTAVSVKSLQDRLGLPLLNQVVGWVIFGVSRSSQLHPPLTMRMCLSSATGLASLFPIISSFLFTTPRTAEGRLLTYFLAFCPCFVILSISAEGLFYVSYCTTLYLWTLVEEDARPENTRYTVTTNDDDSKYGSGWNPRRLSLDDVRVALFFLFFVQVGFFGTGK